MSDDITDKADKMLEEQRRIEEEELHAARCRVFAVELYGAALEAERVLYLTLNMQEGKTPSREELQQAQQGLIEVFIKITAPLGGHHN